MLAPGLRLGWISAVKPIVEQLALIKQQIDPHTQNLSQLVVCELVRAVASSTAISSRSRRSIGGAATRWCRRCGSTCRPALLRFRCRRAGCICGASCRRAIRARAVQDARARRELGDARHRRAVLRRSGRRAPAADLLYVRSPPTARRVPRRSSPARSPPWNARPTRRRSRGWFRYESTKSEYEPQGELNVVTALLRSACHCL